MVLSRESSPKGRVFSWIWWGAILALAVLFRVLPIQSGLPYSDYVDEGHVLHQTIDAFNNRSLDVYWYGLPALPAYCAGASLLIYGPFYQHFHGRSFQEDLPRARDLPSTKVDYDFIAPVELIVAGRIATALLSIATVILAGIFAARLATARAGLLAMLLVAVCPALVTRGSIVIVDTFATFFVLVVLYLCARIQAEAGKPVWRDVAFAGLATGLAFASKYPAATVGLAVIIDNPDAPGSMGAPAAIAFSRSGRASSRNSAGRADDVFQAGHRLARHCGERSSLCRNSFVAGLLRSGDLDGRTGCPLAPRWVCRDHPDAAESNDTTRRAWLDLLCRAAHGVVHGQVLSAVPQFSASHPASVHRGRDRIFRAD